MTRRSSCGEAHSTRSYCGSTPFGNYEIYSEYGISVFAVLDATVDELSQIPPLVRFALLTVVRVGDLRERALRLEPTGRNPKHYDIAFHDLDEGIGKLAVCSHRTIDNAYFEREQ